MLARDVMTTGMATIAPKAPLHALAATMVERGVTALPVVDASCKLLGLVTESDLLHRLAAAERKQHGYLWGVFHSIGRQADEYARSHGQLAAEIMTPAEELVTASEDATAEHIARVMEERRIRHVPVVRDGNRLAGMVTRAHLLRAALQLPEHRDAQAPDNAIRQEVLRAMRDRPWADRHFTFVDVKDGLVATSGTPPKGVIRKAPSGCNHVVRKLRGLQDTAELPGRHP